VWVMPLMRNFLAGTTTIRQMRLEDVPERNGYSIGLIL
jgi:hypothetical protein